VEATVPGGLKETAAAFPPRVMRKEKFELGAAGEPGAAGLQRYEAALTAVFGEPQDRRDGLRWSFEDGFVHLRCSNTEPVIRGVIERGSAERVSDGAAALRKVFREVH